MIMSRSGQLDGSHSVCLNPCFNHSCIFRETRIAKRNCSIITLDFRPEQWRELCREEAGSRKEGKGEWQTTQEERGESRQEERNRYSGGWQGGWEEDSRSRSSSSSSSIRRCVSMDIKILDSFVLNGSSF